MANETYDIQLEADQINTALLQVSNADLVPTAASDNMVRSGGVKQAIQTLETADDALDTRVTALEGRSNGYYNYSLLATGHGSADSTFTLIDSIAGDAGAPTGDGTTTLTLPANYCEIVVGGSLSDEDNGNNNTYRISLKVGGVEVSYVQGPADAYRNSITLSAVYLSQGSETVQVAVTAISGANWRSDFTGTIMVRSLTT